MKNELFHYQILLIGKGITIEILLKNKIVGTLEDSLAILDNGKNIKTSTLKCVEGKQYYKASEKANEYIIIQKNLKFFKKMCGILGFGCEVYMRKFESYFVENYKKEEIRFGAFLKSIIYDK